MKTTSQKQPPTPSQVKRVEQLLEEMTQDNTSSAPGVRIRGAARIFRTAIDSEPSIIDTLTYPGAINYTQISQIELTVLWLGIVGSCPRQSLVDYMWALAPEDLIQFSTSVLTPTLTVESARGPYVEFMTDWVSPDLDHPTPVSTRRMMAEMEVNQRIEEMLDRHIKSNQVTTQNPGQIIRDLCSPLGYDPDLLLEKSLQRCLNSRGFDSSSFLDSHERASSIIELAITLGADVNKPKDFLIAGGDTVGNSTLIQQLLELHQNNGGVPDDWGYDPVIFCLIDHGADWKSAWDSGRVDETSKSLLRYHPIVRRELLSELSPDIQRVKNKPGAM